MLYGLHVSNCDNKIRMELEQFVWDAVVCLNPNCEGIEFGLKGEEEGIEVFWLIGARNECEGDDIFDSHSFRHRASIVDEDNWPSRRLSPPSTLEALEPICHHAQRYVPLVTKVCMLLLLTIYDNPFSQ
jgi:hypothetical protein